jgi:hypothetical protein
MMWAGEEPIHEFVDAIPEDIVEAVRAKRSCGTCEYFTTPAGYGEPAEGWCGHDRVWDHWVCPRWHGVDADLGED